MSAGEQVIVQLQADTRLRVGWIFIHPDYPGRIVKVVEIGDPRHDPEKGSVRDATVVEIDLNSGEIEAYGRQALAQLRPNIEAKQEPESGSALVPDELKLLRPTVFTYPIDNIGESRLARLKPGDLLGKPGAQFLVIAVNGPRTEGQHKVLDAIAVPLPEGKSQ